MSRLPVECKGMRDPTNGQRFFADGHEKIFIIDTKQKGEITMCPACQVRWAEYKKRVNENKPKRYGKPPKRSSGLTLREKIEKCIEELKGLKQNEDVWNSLAEEQRKEVEESLGELIQRLNNL